MSAPTAIRAYLRISKRTDESQSVEQQRYKIEKWRDFKHPGVPIEWYPDEGVSASKKVKRPQRDRLLKDIGNGEILVAMKIDRLARSVKDLHSIVEHAESVGAKVVFTDQDIDTSGPYGRFMLTLLGALGELEAGITAERVSEGYETMNRQTGRHGYGKVPYGFTSARDEETGWKMIRPDPEQAPKLREAIQNIINGATQTSQAEILGISQNGFNKLCRNPRLYGKQPGGQIYKDAAIITMAEWRELQKLMKGPKSWSQTPGYGAVLHCYHCGSRLYLNISVKPERGGMYQCKGKHKGTPNIIRSAADEAAERLLLDEMGEVGYIEKTNFYDDEKAERLAAIEIELENATDKLREGYSTELVEQISQLHQQKTAIDREAGSWEVYAPSGKTYRQKWEAADDAERVELLKSLPRIVVGPGSWKNRVTIQ